MPSLAPKLPSSRLFWRLFASNAIVIPATAIAFLAIASGWHQRQIVNQVDVRLHDVTVSARDGVQRYLANGDVEALRALTATIARETATRITVVLPDGLVVADSQEQPERMNNHADRIEFIQALKRGEGKSERISPTLGIGMRYFAVAVDQDGKTIGLLRTSLPVAETRSLARSLQPLLWIAALVGSFVGCVFGYRNAKMVTRPVSQLTAAANRIAAGDHQRPVAISGQDEMAQLADSFNRMNREMSTREAELRDTADKLTTVLAGMVEGVLAVDVNHRIQFANRAAGELLRFDVEKVHRERLLDIARNQTLRQLVFRALDDEQASDGRNMVDEIMAGADGKLTLAVHASRLPGKPCPGVVLVLHDVTELRKLEKMRQEFVANVSHELKTPLSAIMAYSETLKQGAIEDPSVNLSFLDNIHEQSLRLQDLIMDMLQLAGSNRINRRSRSNRSRSCLSFNPVWKEGRRLPSLRGSN